VAEFDKQLSGNIMTQAVFSSSLLEEAKKILGDKVIADAISNHNEFAEKLLEMIRDLTRGGANDASSASEKSETSFHAGSDPKLEHSFEGSLQRTKKDFPFTPDRDGATTSADRKHLHAKLESSGHSLIPDLQPQVKKTDTLLRLVKK
jgi:hypothetical protein